MCVCVCVWGRFWGVLSEEAMTFEHFNGQIEYDPPPSGISGHQLRMLQASPDRAYGARVQSIYRLEENRRKDFRG